VLLRNWTPDRFDVFACKKKKRFTGALAKVHNWGPGDDMVGNAGHVSNPFERSVRT
jgi:hypothetical protein